LNGIRPDGLCSECGRLFGKPALPGEYHPDI
jgi:hypothetical protein